MEYLLEHTLLENLEDTIPFETNFSRLLSFL